MIQLDIPYRSQRGPDAPGRNDCGPACVAMVAGVDVPTAVSACAQQPNKPITMAQMWEGLRRLGVAGEYRRPLLPDDIVDVLVQRRPVIALVNYGLVPAELKQDQLFVGSHFVVIVGYEVGGDVFLVHDPNFDGNGGAAVAWPWQVVAEAMGRPGWGNMANQGIVGPPMAVGEEE